MAMTDDDRRILDIAWRALEAARILGSDRDDYDEHAAAHRAAEMMSEQDVDDAMPSRSEVREKLGGGAIKRLVAASKKRPHWECNLLRHLESNTIIPEELVRVAGGRLVRRSHLYANELKDLAVSKRAAGKKANEEAEYEEALSGPFIEWEDRQMRTGRPRQHLTLLTFLLECGHISRSASVEEPEGRFDDLPRAAE